ncbi:MAG: trehalose-6-phosphate synthase [Vicinamibacterales bacterium]|nr:trehalose-6-phosphate synthase [Vicinamibacterales bacterium]
MKLSLRLIALLVAGITTVVIVAAWSEVRAEEFALQVELQQRAEIVADRLRDALEPAITSQSGKQLGSLVARLVARERLSGLVVYDTNKEPLAASGAVNEALGRHFGVEADCAATLPGCGEFVSLGGRPVYAFTTPLHGGFKTIGMLAVFLDASAISATSGRVWRSAVLFIVPQVALIALITYFVMRSAVLSPIARTARWMRDLRFGRAAPTEDSGRGGLLDPIASEAASLVQSLVSAQASAEAEARLREAHDSLWTPDRLRVGMQERLRGTRLFVVSNREPYEHVRRGRGIETLVPASGVVTALEPVLCACDGTWVAHGSGNADREVVDHQSHLRVPADDARYTLRRVWLTPEEEEGYYFGFANEGLWPLCHIAHTRPIFRVDDWNQYREVNFKFAQAVLEEMQNVERPMLLVQDYHLALLPRLVKEVRPDARVAMFWHIPWPNPEAFEICPWQQELLDGMLGADLVGFHIQAHCHNFLETIDRCLECRVEWERSTVQRHQHATVVRPYPISVAFPESTLDELDRWAGAPGQPASRLKFQTAAFLGAGVDRVDYTKGIIERFLGIERFLEKYPQYLEMFTFVQIGAPSRTRIRRYRDFMAEVQNEADRINRRFSTNGWQCIQLLGKQHTHKEITDLYRAAQLCLVTSLHDGMNLVAKEFVASRDDDDGVLILSQFTGASRELLDALRVNPYDIEQLAESIRIAIEMPLEERQRRMRHMRRTVKDHNVYRWAADLISGLAEIRLEVPDVTEVH